MLIIKYIDNPLEKMLFKTILHMKSNLKHSKGQKSNISIRYKTNIVNYSILHSQITLLL